MRMTAFFDGGARKDGVGAGGCVLYDERAREVQARAVFLQGKTVNEAEYEGCLLAIAVAKELGATELAIYGDSELVVRQVRGQYRVYKDHLKILRDRVWKEAARFDRVWISEALPGPNGRRRENNERADELCNLAMDTGADVYLGSDLYDETEEVKNMEEHREVMEETAPEERGFAETDTPEEESTPANPAGDPVQPATPEEGQPDQPAEGGDEASGEQDGGDAGSESEAPEGE